jgi:hypothetical protein
LGATPDVVHSLFNRALAYEGLRSDEPALGDLLECLSLYMTTLPAYDRSKCTDELRGLLRRRGGEWFRATCIRLGRGEADVDKLIALLSSP